MLKTDWEKIDKFYIILPLVLVSMSFLLIFTFKSIFSSYIEAYEIDQQVIDNEFKVDKDKLDEVYEWVN